MIIRVRILMLNLETFLSKNGLLPGVAPSRRLFCKLLGGSGNGSRTVST